MRRFLVCVLLVVACKGSKSTGTGSGSAPAVASGSGSSAVSSAVSIDAPVIAAPAARPKEVAELEAALVALVNEPEGDARSKKTCGQLMDIKMKARAVARSTPAGVDAAAWQSANEEIAGSIDGLGPPCGDDPPDDSLELPKLYKNVQALIALLPK
jgi:hypothetical protein